MTEQQIVETLGTKVMRWRRKTIERYFQHWHIWVDDKGLEMAGINFWNPLQNIADAWIIAEKLYIGVLPQSSGSPEDMRFLAVFETHPYDRNIEVYAKTAQEAICKAALEAVA